MQVRRTNSFVKRIHYFVVFGTCVYLIRTKKPLMSLTNTSISFFFYKNWQDFCRFHKRIRIPATLLLREYLIWKTRLIFRYLMLDGGKLVVRVARIYDLQGGSLVLKLYISFMFILDYDFELAISSKSVLYLARIFSKLLHNAFEICPFHQRLCICYSSRSY